MIDLYFVVNENLLVSKQKLLKVPGNTSEKYKCHFKFMSEEWNDASKIVVFKSASFNLTKAVSIAEDGTCMLPWELVCKPGIIICYLSVKGFNTNTVPVLFSLDFAAADFDYSDEPTQSQYEQFVDNLLKDMNDYFSSYNFSYSSLTNIPSIEGVSLEGDLFIQSFGYDLASVRDIDAMFE